MKTRRDKPTIIDVAKLADVSVATVSRVINRQGGVRQETEDRIVHAIKELNYIRDAVARSMVQKETKTIAVIIPDICNPFFSQLVSGIEKKALEHDYFTTLSNSNDSKVIESKIVQHILERGVDGVIVTTADEDGDQLKPLFDANIPVIAVDRVLKKHEVDTVIIGNREGSYEAVNHLIKQGHEKIAIIRGPQDTTPGLERYKGYKLALKEHDIKEVSNWIGDGDFRERSGYKLTEKFYQLEDRPTAIFSSNNLMSLGVIKALKDLNWELGKEVSFIGFDDIEIATFTEPNLTTVSRPMRQLGEVAFDLLFERMKKKDSEEFIKEELILSPSLKVRESCKNNTLINFKGETL